jgi:hypothetical protein
MRSRNLEQIFLSRETDSFHHVASASGTAALTVSPATGQEQIFLTDLETIDSAASVTSISYGTSTIFFVNRAANADLTRSFGTPLKAPMGTAITVTVFGAQAGLVYLNIGGYVVR